MKSMAQNTNRRIMFVINSMAANGAERVMSLLVNKAAAQGKEVILVLVSRDVVEYELASSVKVVFAGADTTFKRIRKIRDAIREFKPRVVVSFLTTCNMYTCVAAMGLNIPVIISERNDPVRDCPSKKKRVLRNLLYRFAKGIIFQTDEAAAHFSLRIRRNSIIIANPVKDDLPYAEYEHMRKEVVAAGRLTRQKNYPLLLEAFNKFYASHQEYILRIYGAGEDHDSLQQLVDAYGINDQVIFEGAVKDLHMRIKHAAMYVLSSDYEGISNSLLEALAMGLPCVSTDCPCGGSRHLIQHGVNGLLVPTGDSEALSGAMGKLADDIGYAKRLGQKATQIRVSHSEKKIVADYFDFIESKSKVR